MKPNDFLSSAFGEEVDTSSSLPPRPLSHVIVSLDVSLSLSPRGSGCTCKKQNDNGRIKLQYNDSRIIYDTSILVNEKIKDPRCHNFVSFEINHLCDYLDSLATLCQLLTSSYESHSESMLCS